MDKQSTQNPRKFEPHRNYQLYGIEDIATQLHGAKVCTILDVQCRFWPIHLMNNPLINSWGVSVPNP